MLLFPCCLQSHTSVVKADCLIALGSWEYPVFQLCQAQVSGREQVPGGSLSSSGASTHAKEAHVAGAVLVSRGTTHGER